MLCVATRIRTPGAGRVHMRKPDFVINVPTDALISNSAVPSTDTRLTTHVHMDPF